MNRQALTAAMAELASLEGLQGCALVEAGSGLVWASYGDLADAASLWEAAVDYWRLHERNRGHFEALGELRAAVMYHAAAILTVMRCSPEHELLLVAAGRYEAVDWRRLQLLNRALRDRIAGKAMA